MRPLRDIYQEHGLYLQPENYLCGPFSIRNLESYLGRPVSSTEELVRIAGTTKEEGTENEGIRAMLTTRGFSINEEKENASLKDLEAHLDAGRPLIVNYFNIVNGVGHYSLITEHDAEHVYLRDSALGFVRFTKKSFGRYWHNGRNTIARWYIAVEP